LDVCLFVSVPFLDIDYFLGASGAGAFAGSSVVAGFAGAGVAFFSAAGAPFAFVGALFSFAGAAFFSAGAAVLAGWAGAIVVAGDAGAGFCCAVATATKATNVSKLTIRTFLFTLQLQKRPRVNRSPRLGKTVILMFQGKERKSPRVKSSMCRESMCLSV
jgi:hypothetical protein